MDLELSDDQLELRDNFRSVLESACPPAVPRAIYEDGDEGASLWKQVVELGWPALAVPEHAGGLGLGFVEVGLLAEDLGRVTAPATLLATVTQVIPALVEAQATELLGGIAQGRWRGALAFAERGRWNVDALRMQARHDQGRWTLRGRKDAVLAGATADAFIVVARDAGAPGLFRVEREAATVEIRERLDPALLLADLVLDDAPAELIALPDTEFTRSLERSFEQAAVGMALHTMGACRRILETTLDYAKVRKQYGRVIGSFQALKHRFADMYLSVERASALCYYAAVAIAEDDPVRAEAAHLAKAAAGACQVLLAQDGLQLHGGLGFTWEQDLHFLLKRAKAGELLCGSASYHRAELAAMLGLTGGTSA